MNDDEFRIPTSLTAFLPKTVIGNWPSDGFAIGNWTVA